MIGGDRQNTRETTADHSVTQSPDEQHVSVSRLLPSWFRNRYPPPEPRRQFYLFIYLFQFYLFICLILERMARGEGSEASAAGLLSSPDEGPIGDVKVSTGGPVGILIRLFLILFLFFCSTKRIVR